MVYTIKRTDSITNQNIDVPDGTSERSSTSLSFPGRNQKGYSIDIATNFLHLLENFANTTAPSNPIEGQIWYDTTNGVEDLKVYDGTTWKLAGSIKKGSSEPNAAILGDLWVDTNNQQVFLYNGAAWILVGPNFSSGLKTGTVAQTIKDSNDIDQVVLFNYINDQIHSIYSISNFIPKVNITGFPAIKSGITISNSPFDTNNNLNKFWGIAEKSEALLVGGAIVGSENFLRKDTSNITNFGFTIRNDTGLSTGGEGQLRLSVDSGQIGSIYHSTANSAFDIRVNNNGETITLVRSDAKGRVGIGINNLVPEETLDVKGTSRFTDVVKIQSVENSINDATGALRVAGGVNIQKDLVVRGNANFAGFVVIGETGNEGQDPIYPVALAPQRDNYYDIGSPNLKFQNLYASRVYGTVIGDVIGNVTGDTLGKATNLLNSTTFVMEGDVSSQEISFDGAAGGFVKKFETLIDSSFIANKTELTTVDGSDTILLYRGSTASLGKMRRATFFSGVPTVPIGAIFPFAGAVPPPGYLFCDGSEKGRSKYADLFSVIGYRYGPRTGAQGLQGIETFRLPDLRGKFALGCNTMDNGDRVVSSTGSIDSNTRPLSGVTSETAGILGNTGGNESYTLQNSDLPDHKHSLIGDRGTQFYVMNNSSTTAIDTGSIPGNGPITPNTAQYNTTTGNNIRAQQTSIDITNPFVAINYIIFTGVFE